MTEGIVGLGRMGAPMAARLASAGRSVVGFDRAPGAAAPPGVVAARSVGEVAERADVVLLSLPDHAASATVSAELATAPLRRAGTVVDLSTIGPAAARDCAETLAAHDVDYVDAPVSGGIAGARDGSLTVMVGAAPAAYRRVRSLLELLGRRVFHVGEQPGAGQVAKLLNNYVSAAALAATSEAVVFGERAGLDPAVAVDVLNHASGRTTASSDKFPQAVLTGSYDFGFAGSMMTKDVTLYLDAAAAVGAPRDVAAAVAALWRRYDAACPGTDFTYLHRFLAGAGMAGMAAGD